MAREKSKPVTSHDVERIINAKKEYPDAFEKSKAVCNKKKNFFKNEKERDIWIKINAEVIRYRMKNLGHEDVPMGSVDEEQTCLWMSKNQLDYDEHNRDAPRFSLEQLIMLSLPELHRIDLQGEGIRLNECKRICGGDES